MNDIKGFTIIELLVVIVAVGVLLAIGIPAFRSQFMKGRLNQTMNSVMSFYQRSQRLSANMGMNYKVEVDKSNEVLRYMKDKPTATVQDSLKLSSGLDLDYTLGVSKITFTVNTDGTVEDDNGLRTFKIDDSNSGRTAEFYISPLGVMEARIK